MALECGFLRSTSGERACPQESLSAVSSPRFLLGRSPFERDGAEDFAECLSRCPFAFTPANQNAFVSPGSRLSSTFQTV